MNVRRTNPSLTGLGCATGGCPTCFNGAVYGPNFSTGGAQSGGGVPYSVMSWADPSAPFGANPTAINVPGSMSNTLAQTSPDAPSAMALTVAQSFGNDYGDAQPGILPLSPNETADNLSFVRPMNITAGCAASQSISAHPALLIVGTFALFYFLNQKSKGKVA